MTDKTEDLDVMFYQLILSMQASAMQHLGKVMSQITGKIERNLEAARLNIDMLEMIQRKTEGNLSEQEKKLLDHILYELRMNYLDEQSKPDAPADDDSPDSGKPVEEEAKADEKSAGDEDSGGSEDKSS